MNISPEYLLIIFGAFVIFLISFMIFFKAGRVVTGRDKEDRGEKLKSINSRIIITIIMFLMIYNFYLYYKTDWSQTEPYKKYLFFITIIFSIFVIFFTFFYYRSKEKKRGGNNR